ncbi:MAG TPA: hypothetical protein VIJ25_20125, partial [Methylococcales bacterium]
MRNSFADSATNQEVKEKESEKSGPIYPIPECGIALGGDKMAIPELWWYQLAKAFAVNTELTVHDESSSVFYIDARQKNSNEEAYFGIEFPWSTVTFHKGYLYEWYAYIGREADIPDFVTINNSIVLKRTEQGYFDNDKHIRFEYLPAQDEKVMVRFFWQLKADKRHVDLTHIWQDKSLICYRKGAVKEHKTYDSFAVSSKADYSGIEPWRGCKFGSQAAEGTVFPKKPMSAVPYVVDDIVIVEQISPRLQDIKLLGIKDFKAYTGIDTVVYQPESSGYWNSGFLDFGPWSDYIIDSGIKNLVAAPLLLPGWPETKGKENYSYCFMHCGFGFPTCTINNEKQVVDNMATVMNKWSEKVPNSKLYIFYPELNGMFGAYSGGIDNTLIADVSGYGDVKKSSQDAWNVTFKYFNDFAGALKKQVKSNFKTVATFDLAGYQAAYAYKSGCDVMLSKCIHRQSINVVVANARGAARAYGKEYGYDFDAWDRCSLGGHSPRDIYHGLLTYFHAGGQYFTDEIAIWSNEYGKPTGWGKAWFDFGRYAVRHPQRGQQKVKIGIYRGFGDEWSLVAGPSAGWESVPKLPWTEIKKACAQPIVPSKWVRAANLNKTPNVRPEEFIRHTYLWDYNLLNIVFSSFGNPYRTDINRLCTGTPYGPVDFIPWDISQEKLDEYSIVLHLGRGLGAEKQWIQTLENYVRQGGMLILA